MVIQVCASLADPRVTQSEVHSLSEAMVELAVSAGSAAKLIQELMQLRASRQTAAGCKYLVSICPRKSA